ncbi:unnamed protein product [Rotaria sp. Silwood2]|nr:unnamed protein product [Rotaria sp. Silwood2]CAF3377717.1 unnamed protein product [Rotaria sp. Silwood2]CAF4712396.1 unnamed protein product [Rotaria sp. Silwood2]
MINLTKRIKKLFEGYELPMDEHNQLTCNQCTVFNTTERDEWLKHVRKYHYSEFVRLVQEREGCQKALTDEPLANISDNEDDDDKTANTDTPRFEFDALTASADLGRSAPQRRFQLGPPASGTNQYDFIPQQLEQNRATTSTTPRDFIPQRQFQPNCPPSNINQYCFISQQQFQPNRATTGTIPRDYIFQQQFQPGPPAFSTNQYDFIPQQLKQNRAMTSTTPHGFIPQQQFQPNRATTGTISRDFISQQLEQNRHTTTSTFPGDFPPQQQLQFDNTTTDPLQQAKIRDKTIEKVGKYF